MKSYTMAEGRVRGKWDWLSELAPGESAQVLPMPGVEQSLLPDRIRVAARLRGIPVAVRHRLGDHAVIVTRTDTRQ